MTKGLNLPDKIFGIDSRILLLWLQPLGLLLIIIVSVLTVMLPKIDEISEKMKEIKAVTSKTVEVNQKRTYLQTVDQGETLNNAKKLADALLPERNSYLLVRIIRDAAAQSGYNVDDFSISMGDVKNEEVKKDNSNYDKIPVSITLIGPADNYISLVKAIERTLPIMSIDNFEMRSQNGVATIRLNVMAYYLRDISNLKIENLTLGDLTPSQDEATLLSTINEYQTMVVEGGLNESGDDFVRYERQDPFSTL
ncbi:MAG: hypothetical protein US68_C0006G0028 [Candidatus Shapirobacteria bacterium GW2011_GWE1_38_10]|uniref:Type IV pilus assembly protein PilO n=1 Tax=Candidatus Shapirobacteria bacterium GW2011_GWE1_38_10 TaxID=1618488 RepID=A0A0G0I4U1_9BACT|nr:MAG: hypothetical protein US68_C0006G0028 [Candidatus Shapirobacteria bacterium GW2011_GWE1_38_10]KKQ65171.1 MAG: hypothetical protein US85_C0001G0098 [Candidatus Shapirobacteria bacterium GW2011_GWF1_38_23]HBP50962.1 hypothetical protein [Candidatus Shapirobacteria bacterium]